MELADHPTIRSVANTNPELLPLFTPIERVVIEVCMNLVKKKINESKYKGGNIVHDRP